MEKQKVVAIIAIVVVLILLSVLIYPKERVNGGLRGEIGLGESAYGEEYKCFGIERNFCPPRSEYVCDALCYGIVYDKKCYIETYNIGTGTQRTETACR